MVTIARQHHDDVRMLPIFRELADERLGLIEQVRDRRASADDLRRLLQRQALPPPMTTLAAVSGATALPAGDEGGFTTPSCYGGTQPRPHRQTWPRDPDVLRATPSRRSSSTGDYASPELQARASSRAHRRRAPKSRTTWQAGRATRQVFRLRHSRLISPLEILDSVLEPVLRGQGFVIANVGNPLGPHTPDAVRVPQRSAWRLLAPTRSPSSRTGSVQFVPAERRRFILPQVTYALYDRAYRELEQSGDLEASTAMFAPELPVCYPPTSRTHSSPLARRRRATSTSPSPSQNTASVNGSRLSTRARARRARRNKNLIRLIESTSFRPRMRERRRSPTKRQSLCAITCSLPAGGIGQRRRSLNACELARVLRAADRDDQVLLAVQHVRHRRAALRRRHVDGADLARPSPCRTRAASRPSLPASSCSSARRKSAASSSPGVPGEPAWPVRGMFRPFSSGWFLMSSGVSPCAICHRISPRFMSMAVMRPYGGFNERQPLHARRELRRAARRIVGRQHASLGRLEIRCGHLRPRSPSRPSCADR